MSQRLPALSPLVRKWQRLLRLRDWEIDARWVSEAEMAEFFAEDGDEPRPEKAARISVAATDAASRDQQDTSSLENRRVRLMVKRGGPESAAELEGIVCHELLHLVVWPWAPAEGDKLGWIYVEQTINLLEGLLVGAYGADR